jgi:hypothetical protein
LPFIMPGDIVLGDNCSFHQCGWASVMAQGMIGAVGGVQVTPKYCPELNQLIFSFLKLHLHTSFGPTQQFAWIHCKHTLQDHTAINTVFKKKYQWYFFMKKFCTHLNSKGGKKDVFHV